MVGRSLKVGIEGVGMGMGIVGGGDVVGDNITCVECTSVVVSQIKVKEKKMKYIKKRGMDDSSTDI